MGYIYAAQNQEIGREAVEKGILREGDFLIKIGKSFDLADRCRTMNNLSGASGRDWRYMNFAGWKFVCCKIVPWEDDLGSVEASIHTLLDEYRISLSDRLRISDVFGVSRTGFELFCGDKKLLWMVRQQMPVFAGYLLKDADVAGFGANAFHALDRPAFRDVIREQKEINPEAFGAGPGSNTLARIVRDFHDRKDRG